LARSSIASRASFPEVSGRESPGPRHRREPAVFLLDEPLSNLDAKLRASAREELERFHRRVRTTTIYVNARSSGGHGHGRPCPWCSTKASFAARHSTDVYDNPADTFVATFLGSSADEPRELGDVIVGFRPEHFRPVSTVTDAYVPFRFKVENIEYLVRSGLFPVH